MKARDATAAKTNVLPKTATGQRAASRIRIVHQRDRQCTYNVTMRTSQCFGAIIIAVKKQRVLRDLCVCL